MRHLFLAALLLGTGCRGTFVSSEPDSGAPDASIPPSPAPARLQLGLFEDTGRTWMKTSGVPWNVRYRYLTKGWADNWGFGARDGAFAAEFLAESSAQGFLPAFAYYQMNDEPGGGEGQWLAKLGHAPTMRSYFEDFRLLMQRAKAFGRPVWILIEPDGTGFLQQQTSGHPSAPAQIAATGLPELASLPDTVAGFGLAFLALRKATGADNVRLGLHVSGWASGVDLFHFSVDEPLETHVASVHGFLAPFGIAANVTGSRYDFLVGDPLDRDADYYRTVRGEERWWNDSNDAPLNSRSFNRYAAWLSLWNAQAAMPWVLWQIPIGNAWSSNTCNSGASRGGYKDNRTAYFLGPGSDTHRQRFLDAGVEALLFGAGEGCQASYENDLDDTGAPYLKTRAAAYYAGTASDAGFHSPADGGVTDGGTPDAGPPAGPPLGCLRVMPLGDSITLGVNGGYRNKLQSLLKGYGCGIDFVGTLVDPYAKIDDKNHDGHSGYTIEGISKEVNGWLATSKPTHVLLLIGTNDVAWWAADSAEMIADKQAALVDQIRAAAPGVWVVAASLPPMTSSLIAPHNIDRAQLGRDYSQAIRTRMLARAAAGQRVHFVDLYPAIGTGDLSDGVHPTEAGHDKLAEAWFENLKAILVCTAPTAGCGP